MPVTVRATIEAQAEVAVEKKTTANSQVGTKHKALIENGSSECGINCHRMWMEKLKPM